MHQQYITSLSVLVQWCVTIDCATLREHDYHLVQYYKKLVQPLAVSTAIDAVPHKQLTVAILLLFLRCHHCHITRHGV
jgi:hypothetical protein